MTTFNFPNESPEYRTQRNQLLEMEVQLRDRIEAVAAKRRELPLGGRLKEDYRFEQLDRNGNVQELSFDDLFGEHESLLLYTMMFGAEWDAPCPSCTSIVDAINSSGRAVQETAALAVVSTANPQQMKEWSGRRGWTQINPVSAMKNSYVLDYASFSTDNSGLVSAMNVFRKTSDGIFHFWSSELASRLMPNGHPRHVDMIWPLWNLLDMTPEGRGNASVPKQDFEHRYFSENILGGPEDRSQHEANSGV